MKILNLPTPIATSSIAKDPPLLNRALAESVLSEMHRIGLTALSLCPGGRNAPFVALLEASSSFAPLFDCYYWGEERSAAFFTLGKSRILEQPAAVIVTSGTAAGELLPAVMEAYYSCTPLLLVTADRPRRFRGSGAPQTAEQVGLFGQYVLYEQDLAGGELCSLHRWSQKGPAHLNLCFEEPLL